MKALQTLREALYSTGVVQPVYSAMEGTKRLWVTCRLLPGQEAAWMALMEALLRRWGPIEKGTEFLIARRFMLKEDSESPMVSGWHIGLQGKSAKMLADMVNDLLPVLAAARPELEPAARPAEKAPAFAAPAAANPPPPAPVGAGRDPLYTDPEVEAARAEVVQTARPRPPDLSMVGEDPVPPQGFVPALRAVQRGVNASGQRIEVTEMPLPHVFKQEMNAPRPDGKGRSVKYTG